MNQNKKTQFYRPTYAQEMNKAKEFLSDFTDPSIQQHSQWGIHKYMISLQQASNQTQRRVDIYIEDLETFFNDDIAFVDAIKQNNKAYVKLFSEMADELLPPSQRQDDEVDLSDLMNGQRQMNVESLDNNQQARDPRQKIPSELKRKFDLYFLRGGQTKEEVLSIRQLGSSLIGTLVTIRAMVVRVSDVKPQMEVPCYSCDSCGYETYQIIHGLTFLPLTECQTEKCVSNKIRGKLIFNNAASKFVPYQELKVQELTHQLPKGAIPRTFTVHCKGSTNIRQCTPGDKITFQGVFLPLEKQGFFENNSLIFNTYIEAYKISRDQKKYAEINLESNVALDVITEKDKLEFNEFYSRLARSIAPEIFGLEDVKKALLLMMVGGVTKEMHDGMKIRGDLNIALIGDPGLAKSQLLRYIYSACPRAVYTTGKGSSTVGLTAAVIRDQFTNEMCLEGGALVMADRGVCCIDEFDKMNESDRTAIHEVMEQQTVSIAKAGITTTLNARTSILAAANPLYGRYNKKMTPHQNINLPAALLSRFDLIFIMLDQSDVIQDEILARHIGYVHRTLKAPKTNFQPYDVEFIKTFVALAKREKPIVSRVLHDYIIEKYVSKRQEQSSKLMEGYTYTTPRTLLGVIRLSQALAKCRFAKEVNQDDVEEAIRLMEHSQETVKEAMIDEQERKPKTDKATQIFQIIKETCNQQAKKIVKKDQLEKKVLFFQSYSRQKLLQKGFTATDLNQCLEMYESLNVIMIGKNTITLVA